MVESWQTDALQMYRQGSKVNEIAVKLEKSRKTISKYLNGLDLSIAKTERAKIAKKNRKEQKKAYRDRATEAQKAQLKRQHDIDVRVLSSEKYFN